MAACPNPAAAELIARLTASRQVVRGHRLRTPRPVISAGLAPLDAFLPFGGYPAGGITELVGDGPKHLLACFSLAHHSRIGQVAYLSPSFIPNPAVLESLGARLECCHFLVEQDAVLLAWCLIQVVASGNFDQVVVYGSRFPSGEPVLDITACRRLFGLVREHSVPLLVVLDDHPTLSCLARPCSLRVDVRTGSSPDEARLTVLKISGSSPGAALNVLLRAAPPSELPSRATCGRPSISHESGIRDLPEGEGV